ncbi:MAG TPA: Fic family protein [Solirubrobacteraceae bacterium]
MPQDPYVYPGTDFLRDRLGISDADELQRVEAERTSAVLALLERRPIAGGYDLSHLKAFHRRIFGDVYHWAGEPRTVAIVKEQSLFALSEHIEPYLTGVLSDLAEDHLLRGLPRQEFVERQTHCYAELNAVHPFREGNGRTLRAFLGQLAGDLGYRITWERISGERNNRASAASPRGDNGPLQAMRDDLVEPLSPSED